MRNETRKLVKTGLKPEASHVMLIGIVLNDFSKQFFFFGILWRLSACI